MGVRVTKRHNLDGTITKTTSYSHKTILGNTRTDTYVEKIQPVQKKGHSLILHLLLCAVGVGFITIPYYTLSSKHYWHL